ncbi:hypothetical protein EC973_003839 [Apophysomyces ossiformis]|uniref:ARM repeat-containing protein n=1 Tax=Apophysomyces ossiformis TaxID=679940 RepID=A0A8H7ERL4_9FUNG|nr:hypothetical protein EC973_003839 [Apophysomyces ossiformis]
MADQLVERIQKVSGMQDAERFISEALELSSIFEQLSEVVETNPSLWEPACRLTESIANGARTESVRTPLGKAGIIGHLSMLLPLGPLPFKIQVLRVLGNLCFDHDENRKLVHEASIIPQVMTFFDTEELVRTTCGFCLNSSMDYDPILASIATSGGVPKFLHLLDPEYIAKDEATVSMAAKVLANLAGHDAARNEFGNEAVPKLLGLVKYEWRVEQLENMELLENVSDILLQLVIDNDSAQAAVVDSGLFGMLLDFLEEAYADDEEEQKQLSEIQQTISKIAVFATSSDQKMAELYENEELLKRFIGMMESSSDVVHQCAVYALGNLARTDAHCIDLVTRFHLEQKLLSLFISTENATFQYAILGCLKHLCLPKKNKSVLGEAGVIAAVSPMLDPTKDMLKRNQFFAIGILKLLCVDNYNNALMMIKSEKDGEEQTPLDLLVAFIKRVDDIAAKSEATRVLCNLIKSIWRQDTEVSADARSKLVQKDIIEAVAEMIRASTFPILKNDGIIALTLVFADDDPGVAKAALPLILSPVPSSTEDNSEATNEKEEKRSYMEVLVDTICEDSSDMPVEIRCNACVLLENTVECALKSGNTEIAEYVRSLATERLQSLTDQHMLGDSAQKVLTALRKGTNKDRS